MRKLFLSAAALAALAGCNTISGIGQDIRAVGNAMTQASEDVQDGDGRSASNDAELCGGTGASRPNGC